MVVWRLTVVRRHPLPGAYCDPRVAVTAAPLSRACVRAPFVSPLTRSIVARFTAPVHGHGAIACDAAQFDAGWTHARVVRAQVAEDDFFVGTQAAVAGGTTMLIDFAIPSKGESLLAAYKQVRAACDCGGACGVRCALARAA